MLEDKTINEKNIKTFKKFDLTEGQKYIYKCCLCGKKTNLDNSASNQGDRLICMNCYNTKFDNWTKSRKWIQREE